MWYSSSSWRSIHWKSRPWLCFHIKFVIRDWWKLLKFEVITWYLDHQEELHAHIMGFRSTHQYYKTAKYELHPTSRYGDTPPSIPSPFFPMSHSNDSIGILCVSMSGHRAKFSFCDISVVNGPMKLIFYSLVVLTSTSKTQNMSA